MELHSHEMEFDEPTPPETRPRASAVIALLMVASGLFSYIGAYPMTTALAGANLISPITKEHDPRLIWAGSAFVAMQMGILVLAVVMRFVSRQQLKRIDTMDEP